MDKPRFVLELRLARQPGHTDVKVPSQIPDNLLDQAWNLMTDFVIDTLDELSVEPTDEDLRAYFLEVCYRLIYREMFTLHIMPDWEKADLERLGTRQRGVRVNKKGSYDDNWDM